MELFDYQIKSFIAIQEHADNKDENLHFAIGLAEEAGEVLSVLKHKYYAGQFNKDELVLELGDVLWHVAALCTANGLTLEDVAVANIAKIKLRYPEGVFDKERNAARHEIDKQLFEF